MLSKEQIKEIEKNKDIFFAVIDLLKISKRAGEVEVTFRFKEGKLKGKKMTTDTIE